MRRTRLASGAIIVLAGALVLTGCTPAAPVRARLSADGVPEFLLCQQLEITGVRVYTADTSRPTDQTPVWEVTGAESVGPGDVIEFGVAPAGTTESVTPTARIADSQILHVSIDEKDRPAHWVAEFWPGTLATEHWSTETGDAVKDSAPCG